MKHSILLLLLTLTLCQAQTFADTQDVENGPTLPMAQAYLGWKYLWGKGVPNDTSKAIFWFQKAAEQDCAEAERQLALIYSGGFGVPQDTQESQKWWKLAATQYEKDAENGDSEALYQLGGLYAEGHGVPQDIAKARQWYRKAAASGNESAQWQLKVLEDEQQGAFETRKQAEQGNMEAQMWFAMKHGIAGHFYTKAECIKWLKVAAQRGNSKAQDELGNAYALGHDLPKDFGKAMYWWQLAAINGNADAKDSLGRTYARGDGVPQDFIQAYKWFNLAAAQDPTYAVKRDSMARDMTKAQIAEGQRLSKEWLKIHPKHSRKIKQRGR